MSKPKTVTNEMAIEAQENLNLLITGQPAKLTWEQCFEVLENAPDGALQTLNSAYLEFEKGQTYNMAFDGFETIKMMKNDTLKDVECVKLIDKTGAKFISGASVLVSACKRITEIPKWIRIIVGEKMIKGPNGDYYDITVKTF